MTIQEVIEKLKNEKQQHVPARYHCRAIMVQNIQQYKKLLEMLKNILDTSFVPIDVLFSGPDVMPDYGKLTNKEYQNKWLIVPGVSEYLRLFHASEESSQRFGTLWHHQFDASSTGRILIPLWGCETVWFDNALHLNNNPRQKYHYFDCDSIADKPQQMSIQVLSGDFEPYRDQLALKNDCVLHGLREWYETWYDPRIDIVDQLLLTRRFKSVKTTEGDICVHVIRDTLTFLQDSFQMGDSLDSVNCPLEAQECLFSAALKGLTLEQAIFQALNVHEIKPLDVMSKWETLSVGQKQLVLLWYRNHPDDTYLSHCVALSKGIEDFPNHLLMAIFFEASGMMVGSIPAL